MKENAVGRTVLITGATGSVSSALLGALRNTKLNVRALVRDEAKGAKLRASGITTVVGDLDDSSTLPHAFEGVDDLWLLTAVGPRAPENSMNAVWAARKAGVKRVVRLSAIGAAHDAPTRNGRLHALSDNELQNSGLRWTILRPHFFAQNLLGSASTIAGHGAFYLNMGERPLGMIDARDVGDVAAQILSDDSTRHDGKIYTPTGPQTLTFADAAKEIGRVIAKPVNYVPVSDEAAREAILQMGMSPWLTGVYIEYGQAYGSGWGDFTTTHVFDVLGREPRSFATFAQDHAAAFK